MKFSGKDGLSAICFDWIKNNNNSGWSVGFWKELFIESLVFEAVLCIVLFRYKPHSTGLQLCTSEPLDKPNKTAWVACDGLVESMLYLDAETGLIPGHVWQACGSFVTALSFHSNANKTNCKMKSFALTLAFAMRFKATRKWPISDYFRIISGLSTEKLCFKANSDSLGLCTCSCFSSFCITTIICVLQDF